MNNTRCENLSEHSLDVAVIAHCLVLIHNKRFGGNLNAERAALLALFHDATEIITGDMPTPVKYFNPEIKNAYKEIETTAGNRLVSMLPDDFKDDMDKIIKMIGAGDDELKKYGGSFRLTRSNSGGNSRGSRSRRRIILCYILSVFFIHPACNLILLFHLEITKLLIHL